MKKSAVVIVKYNLCSSIKMCDYHESFCEDDNVSCDWASGSFINGDMICTNPDAIKDGIEEG